MRQTAFGIILLTVAATAGAGQIVPADVAPNAKWVLHLDVEKLLAGQVGRYALSLAKEQGVAEKLQEFVRAFGFDPKKDLSSVTIYGSDYEPASGVAIFKGKFDREKLLTLLDANEGHQQSPHGERTIHRWTQKPRGKGDDGVRYGAFHSDGTVVISRSKKAVETALDVLDGKVAGKARIVPEAKGAFFVAAGEDLPAPKRADHGAMIASRVASAVIRIGEDGDNTVLDADLTAKTAEDGQRIRQMTQGIVAFAAMSAEQAQQQGRPAPLWAPLLGGVEIGGSDKAVQVRVSVKTATLVQAAEAARKAKAARVRRRDIVEVHPAE